MNEYSNMPLEDIDNPPDPGRITDSLRDTGYDFNTAVADIVDNSIAAKAKHVSLLLQTDPSGEIFLYVADDGDGMDHQGLINAMTYGSKERENKASLGKFGMGLKTASTAFCKQLSVISVGTDHVMRKVQWDLDYIAQNGWKLKQPTITEDEAEYLEQMIGEGTGTLVVWEKVDKLVGAMNPAATKSALKVIEKSLMFHLSMTYQRFLDVNDSRAHNVEIILNDQKVEPWDPFCTQINGTEKLYDDVIAVGVDDEEGEDALFGIRAFVIPRREEFESAKEATKAKVGNDYQGFYVYRENRLIYSGDWLGMYSKEPHGTLLRVELSFDHMLDDAFNVDIKKSRISMSTDLYNYIKDSLMPPWRRAADTRYRTGAKKKVEDGAKGAHDASNRNIDDKARSVENATVQVTDEEKGEVTVTNNSGTFRHKINIHHADKPGQYRVIPVNSIEDGILWNPAIVDGKHAVELNTSHPYYQKVYYPVLEQNVMVTGMDALLWAMAEAELSVGNQETMELFEEMRFMVSRCLKKLVADLPDPQLSEEE